MTKQAKVLVIGIAGASASGKSVLSNNIIQKFGKTEVSTLMSDNYYKDFSGLSFAKRSKTNFDHPNAFDNDLLREHVKQLISGNSVEMPIYDFVKHARSDQTVKVGPSTIIVLEGILVLHERYLRKLMDIMIFVDTPLDLCLMRRVKRDVTDRGRGIESVLAQYEKFVRPMFFQFIEPSKEYADIIVPRGGHNKVAIDVIQSKLREILK